MLIQRGARETPETGTAIWRVGGGVAQRKGEEAGPGRGITKGHFWKPDLPAEVPVR